MTKAEHSVIGIVNDEAAVRDSLRFLLEIAGYLVETFASATELLEAEIRGLTCIILDHHIPPPMTGLELAERLRADGLTIPIFLIVGSPSPTIVLRAAELGIDKVFEKPVSYGDLHDFAAVTRSRGSFARHMNPVYPTRSSRGLPTFLKTGSETDFSGWYGDRRDIEIFLCEQFPEAQPDLRDKTEVPTESESFRPITKPKPTITLRQMAAELADTCNLSKKETEAVLSGLMALAARHLKNGEKVRLTGLGILQVRSHPARMGRNPATGEIIKIKASRKIAFRTAKELKEAV